MSKSRKDYIQKYFDFDDDFSEVRVKKYNHNNALKHSSDKFKSRRFNSAIKQRDIKALLRLSEDI